MRALLTGIATIFLITTSNTLSAQEAGSAKRPMFKNSSERIPAAITELEKAFAAEPGASINFLFRDMRFKGTVVNSVKRYENLYSTIIKNDTDGTLLSFSKRINTDRSVTYVGRIINDKSTDGYELKKNVDGTYAFHKIQMEELIQDY